MFGLLTKALLLGFSAGIAPGALTLYVVGRVVDSDWKHATTAALSPAVTDLPICLVLMFALGSLSGVGIAALGFAGAAYLIYLGWTEVRATPLSVNTSGERAQNSFLKGIYLNLLNPNPYLFWSTVGWPMIAVHKTDRAETFFWFFVVFIGAMAASKILLGFAVRTLVNRSKVIMNKVGVISGILMWLFALLMIQQSFKLWMGE